MHRVRRLNLSRKTTNYLNRKQQQVNQEHLKGAMLDKVWNTARKTKTFDEVVTTLQHMSGHRHRCMYCSDSYGSDIDHFWPKSEYQDRTFDWYNMLLCCTQCNRIKGDEFPVQNDQPLLIDPSQENPWDFLDWDPDTGNVVPHYDPITGLPHPKGVKTVQLLQLDRREVIAASYRRSYNRIIDIVQRFLNQPQLYSFQHVLDQLSAADDHWLLTWCFDGGGRNLPIFRTLQYQYPNEWDMCYQLYRSQ